MTLKEKLNDSIITNIEIRDSENRMYYEYNHLELAEKCEQIADDYAIEFALFLASECETNGDKDGWWFYNKTWKTTNELLIQFKKEKGL